MSQYTIIERTKQRAVDQSQKKQSFIGRNLWLFYAVCYIVYPIAAVISGITEGANFYIRLKTAWGAPGWAMAATVMIVVMIEVLVFLTGKGIVDDLQERVLSIGGPALRLFLIKVIIFLGVFSYSVSQSLAGAPLLDNTVREQTDPVEKYKVNKDSIRAAYAVLITPHQDNIESARKTTWKGKMTRGATAVMSKEQDQIALLMKQMDAELTAADIKNEEIEREYKTELQQSAKWAGNLAGVGQLVCLLSLIFIGLFDDGVREEAQISSNGSRPGPPPTLNGQGIGFHQVPAPTHNQTHGNTNTTPAPTPRRPIGFQLPDTSRFTATPVAKCSYKGITEAEDPAKRTIAGETYLAAYRRFKADLNTYLTHQKNNHGDPETVASKIEEFRAKVLFQEDQLANLGLQVVMKKNRYALEELT